MENLFAVYQNESKNICTVNKTTQIFAARFIRAA
jgi:hypothetical protein